MSAPPIPPNQPGGDFHTGGLIWDGASGVRWRDPDTYEIDGVGPVPAVVAYVIGEGPLPRRLARFGYLQRIVTHEGHQVYCCEKYSVVHLPGETPPWNVQGVDPETLAKIRAAP